MSASEVPFHLGRPLMRLPPRLPGYDLLRPLGGGPMTCVYFAREWQTDTPCAVKLLREDVRDRAVAVKLLQREARAGLAVRHPHLVRFRRAHVMKPPYFLVMEMLEGESLRRRLRRDYRLPPAMALWIIRQTAEALAAMHRAGFIHGDVKPDNIRLVADGTAVLIDLGFAHRPNENTELLRQGYVLGTVNYLAPELCHLDRDTDPAGDMFSLGVTLFEILTGRLPYPAGTLEQTLRRHASDPPAKLGQYAPELPKALVALVDRLLERRSDRRPRAGTLVQQLIGLEIATLAHRRSA